MRKKARVCAAYTLYAANPKELCAATRDKVPRWVVRWEEKRGEKQRQSSKSQSLRIVCILRGVCSWPDRRSSTRGKIWTRIKS